MLRRSSRLNRPTSVDPVLGMENRGGNEYVQLFAPSSTPHAGNVKGDVVLRSPTTPIQSRPSTPVRQVHQRLVPNDDSSPANTITSLGTPSTAVHILGSPFRHAPRQPSTPDNPYTSASSVTSANVGFADSPTVASPARETYESKRINHHKRSHSSGSALGYRRSIRSQRRASDKSPQYTGSPIANLDLGDRISNVHDLIHTPTITPTDRRGGQSYYPSASLLVAPPSLSDSSGARNNQITYPLGAFEAAKSAKHYQRLTEFQATEEDSQPTRDCAELTSPSLSNLSLTSRAGSWLADQIPLYIGPPLAQSIGCQSFRQSTPPRSASPLKRHDAIADLSPSVRSPKHHLADIEASVANESPGKRRRK